MVVMVAVVAVVVVVVVLVVVEEEEEEEEEECIYDDDDDDDGDGDDDDDIIHYLSSKSKKRSLSVSLSPFSTRVVGADDLRYPVDQLSYWRAPKALVPGCKQPLGDLEDSCPPLVQRV
jgi:hypothetical protein